MNLQELLGDAYKSDMSLADIEEALKGKNLVDLSTGGYVDVNKHNREVQELKTQLTNKGKELQDSNNKANSENNENQTIIAQLQEQLKNLNIENNKSNAIAIVSEAKGLLDIKDTDTEFNTFIDNVSTLDKTNASTIVSYFAKQVKSAYDKGKQDGTKNAMGDMGKTKTASGNKADENGDFGKKLAEKLYNSGNTFDYFAKK